MTKTQKLIPSFVLSFVLFLAVACGGPTAKAPPAEDPHRRLTREECTAAVDHAKVLIAMELPATAVDECLATAHLHDHQCLMAAKDAHELGLCPMPGTDGSK